MTDTKPAIPTRWEVESQVYSEYGVGFGCNTLAQALVDAILANYTARSEERERCLNVVETLKLDGQLLTNWHLFSAAIRSLKDESPERKT